jgi:hypothetical protein
VRVEQLYTNIFSWRETFVVHIQRRQAACPEQQTNFVTWRKTCFERLFSTDKLYHKQLITNYLIWRMSCIESFINKITLRVERHTLTSSLLACHVSITYSVHIDCILRANTQISLLAQVMLGAYIQISLAVIRMPIQEFHQLRTDMLRGLIHRT